MPTTCTVLFTPSQTEIEVSPGTTILAAAREAGVFINGLVDAYRSHRAVFFIEHIRSDPPDLVGHFIITNPGRHSRCGVQVFSGFPATTA